ncbi:zinc ribbon domain-containing protein [Paenarthrobacter sp. RAF54_2]|uniref:zinc ribbon domain-containing protein n=1 Tax=Paenarthrobacter sp. RAF54_2 TaxID=3233061 RepID=UPI003F955920
MSAAIQACLGCGSLLFPARLICPRCGQDDFSTVQAEHADVRQTTQLTDGTLLATLTIPNGPHVIARVTGGTTVPGESLPLTNNPNAGPGVHAFIPVPSNVNENQP